MKNLFIITCALLMSFSTLVSGQSSVEIFAETGLTNGYTWRFHSWDNSTHSVTDPDGSVYSENGPARMNLGIGHSIPFEQDDKIAVDVSNTNGMSITYQSAESLEILILWGVPLEGWVEAGYPYWTANTYPNGGFLLVEVPAATIKTELYIEFDDMETPVSDYFVNDLGMAPAVTDYTQIMSLLMKNPTDAAGTVNCTIYEWEFNSGNETEVIEAADLVAPTLFPNPVVSNLSIDLGDASYTTISVYSISGQMVLSTAIDGNSLDLDMSTYNSGVYMVKLENDTEAKMLRVIKE